MIKWNLGNLWIKKQVFHILSCSAQSIPGVPGEDYPIFVSPPETKFDCADQIEGDLIYSVLLLIFNIWYVRVLCWHWCRLSGSHKILMVLSKIFFIFFSFQSFHICAPDGSSSLIKYSFLCPNGTLFNQQYFICDWWFNVDCSLVGFPLYMNHQV